MGKGNHITFWKDRWFGSSNLATQFLELYDIVNQKDITSEHAWDGLNLKMAFRRCVDNRLT